MPKAGTCSVCESPYRGSVEALMREGKAFNFIERATRKSGRAVKAETIAKHRLHMATIGGAIAPREGTVDFAEAIRDEAQRLLDAGELRVRTVDGLNAQGLLDRRAEKAKDRDLMLNIARLMTSAPPSELVDVIEGHFEEVESTRADAPAPLRLAAGN